MSIMVDKKWIIVSEEQRDRLRASFAKNVGSTRGNSGQIRPEQMEVDNG